MEVKVDWLIVRDVASLSVTELDKVLLKTGPGTTRLPDTTGTSDTFAVSRVTIVPLSLVHLFLQSNFLAPVNSWNLIEARVPYLVLERRVT